MRAWYDASLGYQQVQQTRLPKVLPKVKLSFSVPSNFDCRMDVMEASYRFC